MDNNTIAGFWSHVDIVLPGGCWEWRRRLCKGYGRYRIGERSQQAHRWAYELTHGAIGESLVVRHRCDNRPCCNPWHLELGSLGDNNADRHVRGRDARMFGVDNPANKLSPEDVVYIRSNPDRRLQRELGAQFGITQNMVSKIQLRQAWAHL